MEAGLAGGVLERGVQEKSEGLRVGSKGRGRRPARGGPQRAVVPGAGYGPAGNHQAFATARDPAAVGLISGHAPDLFLKDPARPTLFLKPQTRR